MGDKNISEADNEKCGAIMDGIKEITDVKFPIELISISNDKFYYELYVIYRNGFWLSIYSLCEILKCSKVKLEKYIELIYVEKPDANPMMKVGKHEFYHISLINKLSDKLKSVNCKNICKAFEEFEVDKDLLELNDILWGYYEDKDDIFSKLFLTAYDVINKELCDYNMNLLNKNSKYYGKMYDGKYSISLLNFLDIVIFDFIGYMYCRYQQVENYYQRTKEHLQLNASEDITSLMGGYRNHYKKLKGEYSTVGEVFAVQDKFDNINRNINVRMRPVSYKIADEGKKKCIEPVLLKHEYDLYDYKKSKEFDKFFKFATKVKNGTLKDKNNYSNSDIKKALQSLEDLYDKILSEDIPEIDKCMLFAAIESEYKIELYYKWLTQLKLKDNVRNSVLENISMLYSFFVNENYMKYYFPKKEFKYEKIKGVDGEEEKHVSMTNSVFWGCDGACTFYSDNTDLLEMYIDFIIAYNVIRDDALTILEREFAGKMSEFDFYNSSQLNNFLRGFIGNRRYITFEKNPDVDINYDDIRFIYKTIFPSRRK